jgi:hypothetical protein
MVLAACASVLVTASLVHAAPASPKTSSYDSSVLSYMCTVLGGTWSPPSPECGGCYFCLFKDGTLIECGGDGNCSTTTSSKAPPMDGYRLLGAFSKLQLESQKLPQGPADLVPLPTPASIPPEGFCRRNNQGQLLVNVHNQGGADAAASKVRVTFDGSEPADFDVSALAAGAGSELVIDIPNSCFDPNTLECGFTLGVDALGVVAESEETNNNALGLCGPQFQ